MQILSLFEYRIEFELKGIFYFHILQQKAELHTELQKYNTYQNGEHQTLQVTSIHEI